MSSVISRCAPLVGTVVFVAACSQPSQQALPPQPGPVRVTVICSATNITVNVRPSTVIIKHTGGGQGPTKVQWQLEAASTPADVSINPDAAGGWPFEGTPPFAFGKNNPYPGNGKATQTHGVYHYSLTAACPGGPTITIDPDVIVD
jgi:hypothetical protein